MAICHSVFRRVWLVLKHVYCICMYDKDFIAKNLEWSPIRHTLKARTRLLVDTTFTV